MPIKHLGHCHDLVRRVKVVRGEIPLRMVCAPRFDYGRAEHTRGKAEQDEVLFAPKARTAPRCACARAFRSGLRTGDAVAEFKLRAGAERVVHPGGGAAGRGIAVRPGRLHFGILQGDDELLAAMGRPLAIPRALARDGQPLRADAQAADLAAVRVHRGGAHLRPAGGNRRRRATGTTATPGFATPPSRSMR